MAKNKKVRAWLESEWEAVIKKDLSFIARDPDIEKLVNSKLMGIRYALITQILGKIFDPTRDLLSLRKGNNQDGAWSPSTLCETAVVPWVFDNHQVLGTSRRPYSSKPLRRPRLERDMEDVRDKEEWNALFDFLLPLNSASKTDLEVVFRNCLIGVARRLDGQPLNYQVPQHISMPEMLGILEIFLKERSGGYRLLAVSVALMHTLGRAFLLFSRVEAQGINEADSLSGALGDIMCYDDDGNLIMVVEVKDQSLGLSDVKSSVAKLQGSLDNPSRFLFIVPNISSGDREEIEKVLKICWTSGINIHYIDIVNFVSTSFILLGESYRQEFIHEIGRELDKRGDQLHRIAWQEALLNLAEAK